MTNSISFSKDSNSKLSKDDFLNIESHSKGKELLGQVISKNDKPNWKLNPDKCSHIIKNIKYNNITDSIDADIEFLPTTYGKYLKIIMEKFPDKIHFKPIIVPAKGNYHFLTAYAVINNDKI